MSTVIRSYGSCTSPSTSRSSTSGRDTCSSKPSRRICSISTANCSSPRPRTSNVSGDGGGQHLDRDVAQHLAVEPVLDLAAGHEACPSRPDERRGVDAEGHAQRRLVDRQPRQRPRVERVGDRVADGHVGYAGDGDDVARAGLGDVDPLDALAVVRLVTVPVSVVVRPGSTGAFGACPAHRARPRCAGPSAPSRSRCGRRPSGPRSRWRTGWSPAAGAGCSGT